jgi:hypothetical protein
MILYQIAKWAEQREQQLKLETNPDPTPLTRDLTALEQTAWYDVQNMKDTKLWMNGTLEHWILPQGEPDNEDVISNQENMVPVSTL